MAAAAAAGEGTERSDKEIHYAVVAAGSSLSHPTREGGRQPPTQIGERAGSEDIEREDSLGGGAVVEKRQNGRVHQ